MSYKDWIGEFTFLIENVPGYECSNCNKRYFYAPAARDAELQTVEHLQSLTRDLTDQEHVKSLESLAKRKLQIISNWDALVPKRRLP